MAISEIGARTYWENTVKVWAPGAYEDGNNEIEQFSDLVWDYIHDVNDPTIIEIGCGAGACTKNIISDIKSGKYICIDVSSDALYTTKLACDAIPSLPVEYKKGYYGYDPLHLPLADCIVACRTIMHIPDLQRFFGTVYHDLKPGGYFIGDIVPKSERMALLAEKYGYIKAGLMETAHSIAKVLSNNGVFPETLTRIGATRTQNPSIDELKLLFQKTGFALVEERRGGNHFYKFVLQKI